MKLFNDRQILFRIAAGTAESILFYIGLLFTYQITGISKVNIVFFIIAGLYGLFVKTLPHNNFDKRKENFILGLAGLAIAVIAIGVSSIRSYNNLTLVIAFILLVFLCYRSYTRYFYDITSQVNVSEGFYNGIGFLFLVNAAAFLGSNFVAVPQELARYSMLYIIIVLYVLLGAKKIRYADKNQNIRGETFDTAVTSLIIIVAVIISIPQVFNIIALPFVAAFKFIDICVVKLMTIISYPFSLLMIYFLGLARPGVKLGILKISYGNAQRNNTSEYIPSPLVTICGHAFAGVVILAISILFLYFLINYFINKIESNKGNDDFTEYKEFILKKRKGKYPKILDKLTGSIRQSVRNISFMLAASNEDKLRYEYKTFIQKLYSKNIIEDYNHTAQDIFLLMLSIMPEQRNELNNITGMYEEVRYGEKHPQTAELKEFKKNLTEVLKNVQQLQ